MEIEFNLRFRSSLSSSCHSNTCLSFFFSVLLIMVFTACEADWPLSAKLPQFFILVWNQKHQLQTSSVMSTNMSCYCLVDDPYYVDFLFLCFCTCITSFFHLSFEKALPYCLLEHRQFCTQIGIIISRHWFDQMGKLFWMIMMYTL